MRRAVRIGSCSGFYGGPIDVLTGDYLAELTMLILAEAQAKDPTAGYAKTFLTQRRHDGCGIAPSEAPPLARPSQTARIARWRSTADRREIEADGTSASKACGTEGCTCSSVLTPADSSPRA